MLLIQVTRIFKNVIFCTICWRADIGKNHHCMLLGFCDDYISILVTGVGNAHWAQFCPLRIPLPLLRSQLVRADQKISSRFDASAVVHGDPARSKE